MKDNRRTGRLLITAAIMAALVAVLLWSKAEQDADQEQLAEDYSEALGGGRAEDVEADHTGAFALGGLGAVLFLGGIVLVATAPADPHLEG